MKKTLLRKIDNQQFVVGVVGLGYVGLAVFNNFLEKGFPAIGFDIDEQKVKMLREGQSYIKHISSEIVKREALTGRLKVTSDYSHIADCDGIIITVPTPLTADREPDLSYIIATAEAIAARLRKEQIVILESTTYPGCTEDVLIGILEQTGLIHDQDFYVAYSPEREDPNNKNYTTASIPKVVGATSPDGLSVAEALYRRVVADTVPVSSVRVAEASKLLENIFRAVNIALVNELKIAFMKMDIDIWEVIDAAKTKPFGYMPFFPGPGLGGHCVPIDPFYLTWKAREYGVFTRFIELAAEINTSMPDFVLEKVMEVLNEHDKPLNGARILILGLAYKPNIDDDRESPTYYLMEKLEHLGTQVSYNDPFIPVIGPTRKFSQYAGRKSQEITPDYDLLLIVTDHDFYKDIDFTKFNTPVVDTRNILKGESSLFYRA